MFCPKCAEANADEAKYCRACREDLRVVTQAMQKRSPVLLASKFDAFFERVEERLRRDGILSLLFGSIFLLFSFMWPAATLREWKFFPDGWHLLCALFLFALGIWQLLAFLYSRSQHSEAARLLAPGNTVFCPQCGASNERKAHFCPGCGFDIQALQQALQRRWPRLLTDRLDRYIERHRDTLKNARTITGCGALLIVSTLFQDYTWSSAVDILVGFSVLLVGWWDWLVERRIGPPGVPPAPPPAAEDVSAPTAPLQLSSPAPSLTEAPTRLFDETREPAAKE